MKKILGLALAAFMVMGLVGGGTWAYFSDPETSTGNVFAAGTLDLVVDSENPWASTYVAISNLAPGVATTNTTITVENIGNLAGDLYLRVTGNVDGAGEPDYIGAASSEPEWTDGGAGAYSEVLGMSGNVTLSCEVDTGGGMGTVAGVDSANITSAVATGWKLVYDDMPATSGTMDFTLYGTLDPNATNDLQGDNVTFSIEFQLLQDGQTP